MANFSKECIETFLNKQLQLFDEKVAETPQEAEEFLEDNLAVVLDSIEDVRDYLDESGMDAAQLSKDEILQASEVFALPWKISCSACLRNSDGDFLASVKK